MVHNNSSVELKKIGGYISLIRTERGMTQSQFAKAIKTSQSAVARMEKGQQNFSTDTLSKISKVLNREIITLADNSISFKIHGGGKLAGRIVTNTSKNAALALLCASFLNRGQTVLKNIPKIEEVFRIIEVMESVGILVKWVDNNLEIKRGKKINLNTINKASAAKTRAVLMLIGPLVHEFKKFSLPLSGGCKLGERTVRPHLFALENFGIKINTIHDHYEVRTQKLTPANFLLYEMGDTVTENAILAASRIPGKTVIRHASSNYMVQDLCYFLQTLGITIEGLGTSTLSIYGKSEIKTNVEFALSEDPVESMMFLSLAATTNSSIIIEKCPIDFLELELLKLSKMGFKYKILRHYKSENGFTNLVDIKTSSSSLKALEEKIHPMPFPGINIDNLPFFVPIATQAKGKTLIHDWVYENRAIYYLELAKLRANIILADTHRVYIEGPTELKSAEVICPPALRPAAIILIAMLAAKGDSILRNVYSINRGYADLVSRLQKLGARIEILYNF